MCFMPPREVFVATTAAGDYLQFFEPDHAFLAVEQFAERKGIHGCRWTVTGEYLDVDGRKVGTMGILGGTIGGVQGLYGCDRHDGGHSCQSE